LYFFSLPKSYFSIQKTSVLQRVNEVPKIFFVPKSCLKWVYFSIVYFSISRRKKLLARKKFFHVPFVNPLQPRPEYIRDSMLEIQHIDRRSYFNWIKLFSSSDHIFSIGVQFAIDWWQFQVIWSNINEVMAILKYYIIVLFFLSQKAIFQYRQFRSILPLTVRVSLNLHGWIVLSFLISTRGRLLKLRHFLRIYDCFSAADLSWFSSGFPTFFDIICSQVLLYYFEIYLKKTVIQTKSTPGTMQIKPC